MPETELSSHASTRGIGNISNADHTGDYFAAWVRSFAVPSVMVTAEMELIWANASTQALLLSGSPLVLDGQVLGCADKTQDADFQAFTVRARGKPEAWALRNPDGSHIVIRAEALDAADRPPVTALMIYSTVADTRYIWADVGEVFSLTRSETAIVKRMFAGAGADGIAAALDISLETVRTHVRRIYTKVGVNNREQLFSVLSPFRV